MGIELEEEFSCLAHDVHHLMRNVKTPLSLSDLDNPEYRDSEDLDLLDRSLIVAAARSGRVYGYQQEQNGIPVQNLFPIRKNENSQISSSSNVDLELHTEAAFHPLRPDMVWLLCARGDENAGTVYVLLEDILEELSDEAIMLFHMPIFYTKVDESFLGPDQENKEIETAILYDQSTRIVYDRALMSSHVEEARNALNYLEVAIEKCKRTIYLKTGNVLKIDNNNVIHGRTQFLPRYDGTDRWIKRAMVLTKPVPPEHVELRFHKYRTITMKL